MRLPNGAVPVLLTAATADLVRRQAADVCGYATAHPEVAPQAIAAMLFRTRSARPHRALAMVSSPDELLTALRAIADGHKHPAVVATTAPAVPRRVGYVFPGQGGQRPGMGRLCYESVPAFRAEADRCAEAFRAETGASPLDYLLAEDHPGDDTARSVQPALFTQMAALAAMWRSFGVAPTAAIGHSQGEIAAAYVSGAVSLADAVRVVAIRARAADEFGSGDHAMAAVAADRDTCEDLLARCSGFAELAVINSPGLAGISGDRATTRDIVDTLTEQGVFAKLIGVHYPAHTSLINRIGDTVRTEMQRRLDHPTLLEPSIACLGGTLGGPLPTDVPADQYWFWNLRNTVRFDQAISAAVGLGTDTFVELAVHPALRLAIEDNLAALKAGDHPALVVATSSRDAGDLGELTRNLAVLAVNDLDYPWGRLAVEAVGPPPLPLADFPNTRMDEVALWLPYDGDRPEPAGPTAQTGRPQLLTERWVRLARRALVPPRAVAMVDHTGGCAELAAALCGVASDIGATARMLDPNDRDARDTCVILLPESPAQDDAAAATAVSAFFADGAWWPGTLGPITDCWLVTVGGEAVVGGDPAPDPVHAAASAGFRCVGTEHPGVRFRHLDLPAGPVPAASAAAILAALHTRDETELALRGGGLYAKRMVEQTPDTGPDTGPPQHVLILGGTGNLGSEFCEHFAHRGAARITLVSRSGETGKAADRLRGIRSATSTRIDVTRCDIGDAVAVSRLAERYRHAPADVIVHAAMVYSDLEFAAITAEQADRVLRAKVVGIWQVLGAFPRTRDCRVVLCSSVAATIGGRGQIVYAAANRMLDAMAHRLRAEGLDCVCVQWGQWTVLDLDPAGQAKLTATGLLAMRPADALAVGMTRTHGNVVVAAFDLTRAEPVLAAYGYRPLLSQLTAPADAPAAAPAPVPAVPTDLRQRLMNMLAGAIGVHSADGIDVAAPMVAMGLDSLQALEFRRRVKTELNHDLDVSELLGGASLADVLARLDA